MTGATPPDTPPGDGADRTRAKHRAKAIRWITDPVVRADGTASDADKAKLRFVVDGRIAVLIELNAANGISQARKDFMEVFREKIVAPDTIEPVLIARRYLRCLLTEEEIRTIGAADLKGPKSIHRVWADYKVQAHIDRSASTVKADAAARSYGTSGEGVVWAVVDSGIDATHQHFTSEALGCTLTAPEVQRLHRDFTPMLRTNGAPSDDPSAALVDKVGHGTHVAGIIAGSMPVAPCVVKIAQNLPDADDLPNWVERELVPGHSLTSMAPKTRLVSVKVLDDDGFTSSSMVIAGLDYVREVNADGRQVIHGVNLSIGCDWFPDSYAAGQSPLCRAVDDLVASGVVVVVSAGNNGATGTLHGASSDVNGQLCTITDPGNAARAITVGSTHRESPHTYGISYTSSKGPTLDGRLKPDLVAPGERITSAATGALRDGVLPLNDLKAAAYIEDSGTSMAAPHVSGAIAAFLSVRTEYKGNPDEIKRLFRQNATSLDRHEFYQGAGMLDLMRVLANV